MLALLKQQSIGTPDCANCGMLGAQFPHLDKLPCTGTQHTYKAWT